METAQVNKLLSKTIYHPSYYTGVNVASQAQVEPQRARPFRWELLGIDIFDLEAGSDDAR